MQYGIDKSVSSKDLYRKYCDWCDDNAYDAFKQRTFSEFLIANQKKYGFRYDCNIINSSGHRVRGFKGIDIHNNAGLCGQWQEVPSDDLPFI